MNAPQPTLFTRHDTFFGVCEGLGQDLRFNPDYLRIVLGVSVMFSPVLVLSAYFAMGAVVFLSRRLFPARGAAAEAAAQAAPTVDVANDESAVILAKAA